MPCFSFSAPSITPEEEHREREELGEEYQQIQDEIHGVATKPQLQSQDSLCSLEEIQAEIAKMPDSEKRCFLQAMECAPDLVETESNHLFYQANCKSHKEVASRIACYWRLRYQLFGESKAFLPITSANHKCEVDPEAVPSIQVLGNDRANRAVLFIDRKKAITSRCSAMRHLFTTLHMLCKDEKARKSGFVIVESIFGFDLYKDFDRLLAKTKFSMLRDCFPIQLKSYHLCGGIGEKWAMDLVVPVLKHIAGKSIRLRMVCHTAGPHAITTILDKEYMIDPWTLPLSLGGKHGSDPDVANKSTTETGLKMPKDHDVDLCNHRFVQNRLITTLADNWTHKGGLEFRPDMPRS